MNKQLYIFDCLTNKLRVSDGNFMTIGAAKINIFRVAMNAANGGSFVQSNGICRFFPQGKLKHYSLNGVLIKSDALIKPDHYYLLVLAGGCFVCWYGETAQRPNFSNFNPKVWYIYDNNMRDWLGPYQIAEFGVKARNLPEDSLTTFQGLDNFAFYLRDMREVSQFLSKNPQRFNEEIVKSNNFRCPNCWKEFDKSEALAIAGHPDLYGDEYAGEDAQLRFTPTQFTPEGIPLDEKGAPSTDSACPHCHQKLPPFFAETHQHIFSLVGVPAAGKTYYLAALIHQLANELPRKFGIPFRDAEPLNNAPLSDMSRRLFNALTPQEAYINKTPLVGSLYHKVWRHGHFASMPRPFIYNIDQDNEAYSLVVYDNAGESFEPGRSGEENPGAEHLAVSSSILYLFDPTTNPAFRGLLLGNEDPQLQRLIHPPGRQGQLLAETEMRIRTRRNISPGKKIDIPLALLIGKCDTWQHLLGPEPLLPIVQNGIYMPEHVNVNSNRLRRFFFNISPHICANVEAISSNVRYFAISSLGASPIEFTDPQTGATLIGPASGKVHPIRVSDPVIWALNCLEPKLFPSANN